MISEPTRLSKIDLEQITYHEDNVIPKDIKKTRKSKKSAKSKNDEQASIIEEHFARRMEARTRTPSLQVNDLSDESSCQNPDCTALAFGGLHGNGLCSDCYQATIMTRRTPSRR